MRHPMPALPFLAYALAAVVVSAQGMQAPRFVPPRLKAAQLPPLPAPTVAGGGEVLIEAIVDRRGAMTRPLVSRTTPPYTDLVLEAISHWQFEPAREIDYKGLETTVEMPVAVIAIYRPPILLNAPTIGEQPKNVMRVSGDVAVATATVMPLYPPNARDGGVVLYEIALDLGGRVTETREVESVEGFQSVARDALAQFRFRPGSYRARPVPSTTYVIFGFRTPVGLASPSVLPSSGVSSFR
jgi:hypothetical protein